VKKNVLITGGSGFIGSYVVDALVENKYKVTILDLNQPKRKDVKFIQGSILDKSIIRSALKNINIIFHLAAVSDITKVKEIPVKTIKTNILGTTFLLEGARNANIDRFVFASSIYSYGAAGNLYTTSKTASELIIKNYKLIYGQKFTILRYATAYGPRNREVDAVSIFVRRALKNLDLIIHGNGQQKRNYVCAEDLGYGSLFALEKKATNKIITLVSKRDTKIIDLARMIIKITKSKSKIFFDKKKRRLDDFTSLFSYKSNHEKNLMIWRPKYSLEKGLKKYIELKIK
jgi:UDP-glucose 4-epimerase